TFCSCMNVVVLNTGSELLLGRVLNTHLTYLAREIFPLGLRVESQLTVPDGPAIHEALAEIAPRADIVFVTGGLGPTTDDITREAAAALLNLPLKQDPEVAARITNRLRTRGFPMTDRILRQAEVPEGATVLPNANGTAPGLYLVGRVASAKPTHLFLLPGPPRELQPMFQESVLPILRRIVPPRDGMRCGTFRLACVGESMVEAAVGERLLALPEAEVGYCARMGEVDVRVIGPEATVAAAEEILREAYPLALFTTEDEELESAVIAMLRKEKATLAVAESCTGGYLAHRLTNVPGASEVFLAGFVTYANSAKISALGVDPKVLDEFGAVSAETAAAMAAGAIEKTGATCALATTGIAGPGGGSEAKPVGTVFIALATSSGHASVLRRRILLERTGFKHQTSQAALQLLREYYLANGSAAAPNPTA
ncbi:MAG: CinA family nicotinamide mononucleotide deamidase-related protein, partial [Chthoniobacterales bacterium]